MPTARRSPVHSRRAWLAGGSLFSIALLGFGGLQAVGLLAHQRHRTHTVISEALRLVDVSSSGGSVTVQGTTDGHVTIDADISEGLFKSSHSESVQAGRLILRSNCPGFFNTFCKVDYTIRVPQGLPLKARSSGGPIHVNNVNGDLDLSSSGGGIHVVGGQGRERLDSSGGGITVAATFSAVVDASSSGGGVHLTFGRPPVDVKADSSGGGVRIDLPNTPDAYRVDISSSGGSALNDVRTDPTATRAIKARSSGGSVHVEYVTQA